MPEPQPAGVLADQDAGEPHLRELLPQRAIEPSCIVTVAQPPQMRDRGMLAHEIARGVAQHRLFVVQEKRHRIPPFRPMWSGSIVFTPVIPDLIRDPASCFFAAAEKMRGPGSRLS